MDIGILFPIGLMLSVICLFFFPDKLKNYFRAFFIMIYKKFVTRIGILIIIFLLLGYGVNSYINHWASLAFENKLKKDAYIYSLFHEKREKRVTKEEAIAIAKARVDERYNLKDIVNVQADTYYQERLIQDKFGTLAWRVDIVTKDKEGVKGSLRYIINALTGEIMLSGSAMEFLLEQDFAKSDDKIEIYYSNENNRPLLTGIIKDKKQIDTIFEATKVLTISSVKYIDNPKYLLYINYSGQISKVGYSPGKFVIKGNSISGYKFYKTNSQIDSQLKAVLLKSSNISKVYSSIEKGMVYYPWDTYNFAWQGSPNYKTFYIGTSITQGNGLKGFPNVDSKSQIVIQMVLAENIQQPGFRQIFSTKNAIRITKIDNYYPGYVRVFFKILPVDSLPVAEKLTPYFDSVKVSGEKFYTKGYSERLTFSFISEDGKNLGLETAFRQDLRKAPQESPKN